MTDWLPGARQYDMSGSRGNGPFNDSSRVFLGVILHVNQSDGNLAGYVTGGGGPDEVCPNFEVYKDGSFDQYLPLMWSPWCQAAGNFNYAAIETEGYDSEPLTSAQIFTIAGILAAYSAQGMPLQVADAPGQRGLGTHVMGGAAWGGHTCPGSIRAGQRAQILAAVGPSGQGGGTPIDPPAPSPEEPVQKDLIFKVGDGPDIGQTWILLANGRYIPIENGVELGVWNDPRLAETVMIAPGDVNGASITGATHAAIRKQAGV